MCIRLLCGISRFFLSMVFKQSSLCYMYYDLSGQKVVFSRLRHVYIDRSFLNTGAKSPAEID